MPVAKPDKESVVLGVLLGAEPSSSSSEALAISSAMLAAKPDKESASAVVVDAESSSCSSEALAISSAMPVAKPDKESVVLGVLSPPPPPQRHC